MNFLQSLWWTPLFALLPLIVVFYLLKLKRRRVPIPSTLLWRRSVQDMVANSPFQKLRNNILMWLQLLLLALLILAFLRPVMKLANQSGTTLILLIDNSASMQAFDGAMTRMERAKSAAQEAVDSLASRDEAIVVTFADRTNIVQTLTSDRGLLRDAIASIKARDSETNLSEAGLLLQSLTSSVDAEGARLPRENTKTIVLSDGVVQGLSSLADVPNVEYVRIGDTARNLGITGLDVRESFGEGLEYQIFASVTNASDAEEDAMVELAVEGQTLDVKQVTVGAGKTEGVVFSTAEVTEGLATVKLDGKDDFARDDMAVAQIVPPDDIEVLLVTDGNPFLEEALAIDPRVSISRIRPTDYTPRDEYDIVFFDNCGTGEIPSGNFVFLNSLPPVKGFEAADPAEVENPRIIDWNRVHPLTRFANFEEVLIGKAMAYRTPQSAVHVVEALETDLITLHETETQRVVVVGFDIFKSYWPLDVSFPIFMANMMDYFASSSASGFRPAYRTGETIALHPGKEDSIAIVTTPSGRKMEFSFEGISTAYLTDTAEAGLYQVDYDRSSDRVLPVNLLSVDESRIASRESLEIGGRQIAGTGNVVKTNREIWHWLALAALGVMMVEWLIYCRRTFA